MRTGLSCLLNPNSSLFRARFMSISVYIADRLTHSLASGVLQLASYLLEYSPILLYISNDCHWTLSLPCSAKAFFFFSQTAHPLPPPVLLRAERPFSFRHDSNIASSNLGIFWYHGRPPQHHHSWCGSRFFLFHAEKLTPLYGTHTALRHSDFQRPLSLSPRNE